MAKLSKAARTRLNRKLRLGAESDWKCAYCGSRLWLHTMTVDHIIPKARGGSRMDGDNYLPACQPCNVAKGHDRVMRFRPIGTPQAMRFRSIGARRAS